MREGWEQARVWERQVWESSLASFAFMRRFGVAAAVAAAESSRWWTRRTDRPWPRYAPERLLVWVLLVCILLDFVLTSLCFRNHIATQRIRLSKRFLPIVATKTYRAMTIEVRCCVLTPQEFSDKRVHFRKVLRVESRFVRVRSPVCSIILGSSGPQWANWARCAVGFSRAD